MKPARPKIAFASTYLSTTSQGVICVILNPCEAASPSRPRSISSTLSTPLTRRDAALASALMVAHLRGAMSYWTEILEPGTRPKDGGGGE